MKSRFVRIRGVLGVLLLLITACHHHPRIQPLSVKVLVADFDVSEDIISTPRQVKGWWFGSRDIYQNPNAGRLFADILARRLNNELSFVDVYSRTDFKYYLANKKERLKKKFPQVDDAVLKGIFDDISPRDFARDLGLDKVIIGKLNRCYTSHSRAFHWWSSVVEADVILLDAESGQPQWSGHFYDRSYFHSQYGAMQQVADKIVKSMKREYFYKSVGE